MELVKHDKLLFKTKVRWDKKLLSVGMQNNSLQKYYRSRNSLWYDLFKHFIQHYYKYLNQHNFK